VNDQNFMNLAAAWKSYELFYPEPQDAPKEVRKYVRDVFYAGAMALMKVQDNIADIHGCEDSAMILMEALQTELLSWASEK
jgi:hypothetical protein